MYTEHIKRLKKVKYLDETYPYAMNGKKVTNESMIKIACTFPQAKTVSLLYREQNKLAT